MPTPGPVVPIAAVVVILLLGTGEITGETGTGWLVLRLLGVGLSLYAAVMLPWSIRALGRFYVPGAGVLHDHELVTSGPFRLVRHPLYAANVTLWLATALGMLNSLLLALWPVILVVLSVVTHEEEKLLKETFRDAYARYQARTGASRRDFGELPFHTIDHDKGGRNGCRGGERATGPAGVGRDRAEGTSRRSSA